MSALLQQLSSSCQGHVPRQNAQQQGLRGSAPQMQCRPPRPLSQRTNAQAVSAPPAAPEKSKGKAKQQKGLTPEVAKDLYRDMFLGREFEEMCAQMYYRGKMFGFVHLYSGQEAVSTGVLRAMRPDDYVCSTYRDHVHALSKGVPAKNIMAELFGKKTGICRGQGGSMHMFSAEHNMLGGFAFIGEGIPIGLGAAYGVKYRKESIGLEGSDQVVASFFGDGTCNVGQFYECLNMASLYKLPIIFVVENNLWAIGMNHPRATGMSDPNDSEPHIWKKGPAFGMPGVLVDGMDVQKVREVAMEAVARARAGLGPTLIEAETYRFRGHSLADPDELRRKEEKEHYAARDPIPQLKKVILEGNILTQDELKAIEKDVLAEVDAAVQFAEESPKPDKAQLLENVFADPKGFGIHEDGRYKYQMPGFSSGNSALV